MIEAVSIAVEVASESGQAIARELEETLKPTEKVNERDDLDLVFVRVEGEDFLASLDLRESNTASAKYTSGIDIVRRVLKKSSACAISTIRVATRREAPTHQRESRQRQSAIYRIDRDG